MTRIAVVSDIHGDTGSHLYQPDVVPKADILIVAGDLLPTRSRSAIHDAYLQYNSMLEFDMARLRKFLALGIYKHIVLIAGNHDWVFELLRQESEKLMGPVHYLRDSCVVLEGLKFYGSPWQPRFLDWAFNLDRNSEQLRACWDAIPDDTNVLVTHGPPYGILDEAAPKSNKHLGCELLLSRVKELDLFLHAFGHIHGSYGKTKIGDTIFVNGAMNTEQYEPLNPIQVVEV